MYKLTVKNNNVSTIQPSRNDVIRNVRRKNMYGELANNLYQKMNSLMIFDSSTDTLFGKMKLETRLSREFIRGKPIVQGKTITLEAEIPKLVPIDASKKWVDFKDYGTEFCKKDGNPNKVVYEKKVYSHTIPQSNYSALALALRGLKNSHRLDIQMHRERMKKLYTETRMVRINERRNIELKMIGLCFTKPNEIKRVYDMRQAGSVFDVKKPLTNDKYIGIELEFYSESETEDLGAYLQDAGLGKYVYLKDDGSIRPDSDMRGHEVNILAKESEIEEVVKKVCSVLNDDNAKVNDSCGMHVHLDMREVTKRSRDLCFSNLVSAQSILYAMQPSKRRDNQYCKRTRTKGFETERSDGARYKGINPQSFRKFQTIEVRIHSGTTNATKIINWVKILTQVVNLNDEVKRAPTKPEMFCKKYGITDNNLLVYIKERIERFNREDNPENGVAA